MNQLSRGKQNKNKQKMLDVFFGWILLLWLIYNPTHKIPEYLTMDFYKPVRFVSNISLKVTLEI